MDTKKQMKLIKLLETYDIQGISFYDAKQALLQQGYSLNEIEIAVASAPFDGKKNIPHSTDDVTAKYESDTEAAKKIAKELLIMDADKQQRKTRSNALLSMYQSPIGGSINPVNTSGVINLADDLGIPLFKLAGLGVFIAAILYGLAINRIIDFSIVLQFIRYYSIAISVLFSVMLVRSEIVHYKRKVAGDRTKRMLMSISYGLVIVLMFTFEYFLFV